jgi:hypothetical protein
MEPPPLSTPAKRVLSVLRESAMDGYVLLSKSGVTTAELSEAALELIDRGLIVIKGEPTSERVLESYMYVPPNAIGYVDVLLGRVRYQAR